jgi:predicted ATP-grasp superfamily ATP-dependent carboligase
MIQEPNIIVIGVSARAAAFSALRAGMRPYAIDLFADSDLVEVCPAVKIKRYPQDFEQALAEAPQAPWIYTGGLENYPDLVERMAALRPLYGNGAAVLRKVRSPEVLAACLGGTDFEMPEIRTAPPPPDSKKEWLRKPRRSSGGLGIRRTNNLARDANEDTHYYQQFIPGVSRSALFLADRSGCRLLGVTEQQSGVPELPEEPFLYTGSRVSHTHLFDVELMELGDVLTREFGLRGLFNVDFIDVGRGIWPLEVNPRYTASVEVLEHSQGKNFLTMHMAAFDLDFQGENTCRISKRPRHVAKQIVYATCDCIVTPEMDRLRKAWNSERLLPCLADIPRPGTGIHRGHPVATVIADGASDEEVQQVLDERVHTVRQTLSPA